MYKFLKVINDELRENFIPNLKFRFSRGIKSEGKTSAISYFFSFFKISLAIARAKKGGTALPTSFI